MNLGTLASREIVAVGPAASLRRAAQAMAAAGVGSVVVLDDGRLAGILTERDLLRAVAADADLDAVPASAFMTAAVVTASADWEVYEAAAEMAARRIRHLVVLDDAGGVLGIVSVRDVLLAGQRVELAAGGWAVLRDPLTFTIRERRKLQRYLLGVRGVPDGDADLVDLLGLLLGSWSFDAPVDTASVRALAWPDQAALRDAVLAELPELQRAVHPAPGWRTR
jgi:CBS domain-containing protein